MPIVTTILVLDLSTLRDVAYSTSIALNISSQPLQRRSADRSYVSNSAQKGGLWIIPLKSRQLICVPKDRSGGRFLS
ncbi:hypothetical protein AB1N83_007476 [Pleurotus pulmonarius]